MGEQKKSQGKSLRGKVADILSEWEIAINIGTKDGVQKGMKFTVLGEKTIYDPDTNKSLGRYQYNKVSVKINKVEDSYCVGTSSYSDAWSIASFALSSTASISRSPQVVYDKKVTTSTNIDIERNVQRGDIVVQE